MVDLISKLPSGAAEGTLFGIIAAGVLKLLSDFINKMMDRKGKQDTNKHESAQDIIDKIWAKVDALDKRNQELEDELNEVSSRNVQTLIENAELKIYLDHCKKNGAESKVEIVGLKAEVIRLKEIITPTNL